MNGVQVLQDLVETIQPGSSTGWILTEAVAVSADGKVIAGNSTSADVTLKRAWVARLPN